MAKGSIKKFKLAPGKGRKAKSEKYVTPDHKVGYFAMMQHSERGDA